MFTEFLSKHVRNNVMGSNTILNAFAKHTAADSPSGVGNLNRKAVETAVTWGSGPKIIVRDSPGGLSSAEGYYNSSTGNIELSKSRMDHLESVLSGKGSHMEKLEALLPVYMTLLHETVHYGDYLDGLRQDGGEPGEAFEFDVWLSRDHNIEGQSFKAPYMIENKYEPANARKIINEKKGQDVIPTVPNK